MRPHQQFLLKQILAHVAFLEESLAEVQKEVEQRLDPFEEVLDLLERLPCVQRTAAISVISEIGIDMSRFPTHKHLASWAGVCPGNKQSGGKRLSGATTSGNPYLRAILCEIACSLARSKEANYFTALYHRIARRRGKQRAIIAVAHSLLVCIYYIIRDKKEYEDLGADYFDKLDTARIERHHIHRLEQLGYTVTLSPKEAA